MLDASGGRGSVGVGEVRGGGGVGVGALVREGVEDLAMRGRRGGGEAVDNPAQQRAIQSPTKFFPFFKLIVWEFNSFSSLAPILQS